MCQFEAINYIANGRGWGVVAKAWSPRDAHLDSIATQTDGERLRQLVRAMFSQDALLSKYFPVCVFEFVVKWIASNALDTLLYHTAGGVNR